MTDDVVRPTRLVTHEELEAHPELELARMGAIPRGPSAGLYVVYADDVVASTPERAG